MPRLLLRTLFFFLAAMALLSGCTGRPPGPSGGADGRVEALRLSGYRAGPAQELQQWQATWSLASGDVDVLLVQPRQAASALPVVLYLPGLGETVRSGEAWRRGWAEAGYAVLSVQALDDGPAVYRSSEAQAGALQAMHQRYFSAAALAQRLQRITQTLLQVGQRAAAGEPAFARLDLQRLAVAGFDLGAQSAAALLVGPLPDGVPAQLRAAILFSPHVEAGDDLARFATLSQPLLLVTGAHDDAPLTWQAPGHRQRLWGALPDRGSYQLLVEGDHSSLAGNAALPRASRENRGGRGPGSSGRPAGGPPPGGAMPFAGFTGNGGPPPGGRPGRSAAGPGGGEEMPGDPRQSVVIQAVSLAFLDARLQGLEAARQWLDSSAQVWLSGVGELQRKQ